jgi:NADH:ubiquinone oxidoreductase subunit 6 (subunit J)
MFLFVVMLLDIPATEMVAYQRGAYPAAGILMFFFGIAVYASIFMQEEDSPIILPIVSAEPSFFLKNWDVLQNHVNPVEMLGVSLYGIHVDLLIIASYVLLVAMVGAVALTLKRRVQAPMHDVFAQHNRDFQKVVYNIISEKK